MVYRQSFLDDYKIDFFVVIMLLGDILIVGSIVYLCKFDPTVQIQFRIPKTIINIETMVVLSAFVSFWPYVFRTECRLYFLKTFAFWRLFAVLFKLVMSTNIAIDLFYQRNSYFYVKRPHDYSEHAFYAAGLLVYQVLAFTGSIGLLNRAFEKKKLRESQMDFDAAKMALSHSTP